MGLRPLVKGEGKTSALSRDHVIHVDASGLLTITGGKWTTYRHMAEDTVDHAITLGKLRDAECITRNLHIHGYVENSAALGSRLKLTGGSGEHRDDVAAVADAPLLPRGGTASARLALAWSSHRLLLWNAGARWPRQRAVQSRGRNQRTRHG